LEDEMTYSQCAFNHLISFLSQLQISQECFSLQFHPKEIASTTRNRWRNLLETQLHSLILDMDKLKPANPNALRFNPINQHCSFKLIIPYSDADHKQGRAEQASVIIFNNFIILLNI
jgi:3-methyladenine DNA glycosylase Tag